MGKVATSLTAEQKAYFAKMKFGDFTTWPEVDADTIKDRPGRGQPKLFGVACMTYASEFFSWYAGSETADVYFCPERHGTYFGGFYMKDMPAMGQKNYDISTSVTGDSGEAFVDTILTSEQRKVVTATVEQQRAALKEVVSVRTAMSRELRKALTGGQLDRVKVIALGRRYGELDGEMSWYYATAFAKVNKTLTADQRAALVKLRNLNGYVSAPYYLYSDAVKTPKPVTGSDALFFPPKF
jgi:Spy/CpxP family protein refolding chaperone